MKGKIKSEIQRLIKAYSPIQSAEGKYKVEAYEYLLTFIDTLKEDQVSNDLEEAACEYADGENPTCPCEDCLIKTFKAGAQWQKQQDQSTIELAEDHAYLAGQEQMIDKACKWLKSYRQDTPDGTGYISGIVNDKTIEDFKQSMEE